MIWIYRRVCLKVVETSPFFPRSSGGKSCYQLIRTTKFRLFPSTAAIFASSIIKIFSNSDVLFSPRLLRGEEVSTVLKHDSLQTVTFLFPPAVGGGKILAVSLEHNHYLTSRREAVITQI
ncbi:MAG: hypothetical protein LBR79_04545 [Oscillospiraceae bacterium]|nr:hypothetical protein [Oscillospiraceae bacterium]